MGVLDAKSVIVTGAGRGIGRALAAGFAREGAAVCCASRTLAEVEALAAEIASAGGRAIAVRCDVGKRNEAEAMVEAAVAEFGELDILVSNAGVFLDRKPVAEGDPDLWEPTVQTNLLGPMYCARAAIPHLRARGGGKIIVVGSGHAHRATPGSAVYAASKAGLWMFVRVLAQELATENIAVNHIVTGPVATSMAPSVSPGQPVASSANETFKAPEEIVPLALFLATQPDHGPTGQSFSLSRRDL